MSIIPILNNMNNKNNVKNRRILCIFNTTDVRTTAMRERHVSLITHFATDKQKRNTYPPLCVEKEHLHIYECCSYINSFFLFTKDRLLSQRLLFHLI